MAQLAAEGVCRVRVCTPVVVLKMNTLRTDALLAKAKLFLSSEKKAADVVTFETQHKDTL